ncbi:hypothetical protein D3C80_1840890 [compost metagenome]
MALQLADQCRDDQANGLCRTCGVWDDIFSCRSRCAKIFAPRTIHQRLGAGIGVNGGHSTHLNTKTVLQGFCQRSQAIGGAGCDRNNGIAGVNRVVIHVEDDCFHVTGWR